MRGLRLLGAGLALAALAGCGSNGSPFDRLLHKSQPSPRFLALHQAGAPVLSVNILNRKALAVMFLETRRAGVESWISADGVALQTADGFLVGARGMGDELMSADVSASRALVLAGRAGQAQRFHSMLDGNNQIRTRSFVCDISLRGPRELDERGAKVTVRLMQEDCHNPEFSFSNLYWVTQSGARIIQSRQWLGPYTGSISMRKVTE
ncbi:YjbF family lipoprotein [Xinfangfangia pollutisoli]|uniref:YjbF family lipoprotein n=1 Tax=Xinfangfangia pollutisoli TaxID=2865960 RepID=UPI001CD37776|nr:YjbF family lipoprotein [Xinfangfangia pollutisoli]